MILLLFWLDFDKEKFLFWADIAKMLFKVKLSEDY